MRYVKWAFWTVIVLVVGGFLHYTLPQHDIVRVVGTYQERQDLTDWTRIFWSTPDDQSGTLTNRNVQFIQAIRANGKPMVYRNEDTGWGWPPYFKFDTATLQTQADDLRSTAEMGGHHPLRLAQPVPVDLSECGRHPAGGGARRADHPLGEHHPSRRAAGADLADSRDVAPVPRTHHRPGGEARLGCGGPRRCPRRCGHGPGVQ